MNWIETLIIVCGLSMDVFASVEQSSIPIRECQKLPISQINQVMSVGESYSALWM